MKKIVIVVVLVLSLTIFMIIGVGATLVGRPTNTHSYQYYVCLLSSTNTLRYRYSANQCTYNASLNRWEWDASVQCYSSSDNGANWTQNSDGVTATLSTGGYTFVEGNYNPLDLLNPVSPSPSEEPSPSPSEEPSPSPSEEPSPSPSVEPSPLPEGGFKTIIQPILGDYLPTITAGIEVVTAETETGLVTTTTTKDIVVPDYLWIAGAVIFTITLYTVLRLLGSIAQGGASKWRK